MNYSIDTISIKRFLAIWIIFLIAFIIIFFVLNIIIKLNGLFFSIGFVVALILGLIIALKLSKRKNILSLTERTLTFDNSTIELIDIEGYYINRDSPTMTELDLKHKTNNYKITSVNYGEKGREFETFLSDFLKRCQKVNNNIKELSFYDFHNKQYIFVKTTVYFIFTIVVLLNLIYLYLVFVKGVPFNWKLLFLNFIFIWLYDFHRKNEKKFKNQI